MDAEDSGHSESSKRKSDVFRGGSKRRALSGSCSPYRRRRTRDWEPHLLPSESRAVLAGAHPAGAERDAAIARNHHRPRHNIVPAALRRGHRSDIAEVTESFESAVGPQVPGALAELGAPVLVA